MSTPHNSAKNGDIAETVLMPGDPLRAKFAAENFLENSRIMSSVRGIPAYTGLYKGKPVSIMASGMGMPSMGIYSYELYKFYDVENIIRIGSAGAISDKLRLRDVIIASACATNSNFASQYRLPGIPAAAADFGLLKKAYETSLKLNKKVTVGTIFSSDTFYDDSDSLKEWQKMNVLAVEMESYALYLTASRLNKKALSICTISDCPFTGEECTADERETSFCDMIEIALETAFS